jgi:hypothetical protein
MIVVRGIGVRRPRHRLNEVLGGNALRHKAYDAAGEQ